jgi:uncharacterized coiled-coil DUF342 family protein
MQNFVKFRANEKSEIQGNISQIESDLSGIRLEIVNEYSNIDDIRKRWNGVQQRMKTISYLLEGTPNDDF